MKFKSGIKEKNVIVKCGADKMLPFMLLFGIFVILFGTLSSGGGFQGGVLVSGAAVLLYLGYNYKTTTSAINMEVLRVGQSLGAIIYVALGFAGLFAGAVFCKNIFYTYGKIGDLFSGGNITFMGYAVGFRVLTGVGFLLLLMIGLLIPDVLAKDEVELTDEEEEEE